MKSKFIALLMMSVFVIIFAVPLTSFGQDTLVVPTTYEGSPVGAMRKFIMADTLANGDRKNPNRVYKLTRGSRYLWDATQPIKFNLTIVADNGTTPPPVIVPAILSDNTSPGMLLDIQKGNFTMKNIWIKTLRPDLQQVGWNDAMVNVTADSARIQFDGCVFEFMTGGQSNRLGGKWTKLYIRDCKFINGQHPTSWFGGGAQVGAPNRQDTIVMTNNSLFYCGGYFCVPNREYTRYVHLEHNTIVANHVNPLYAPYLYNAVIKNNIFYATVGMGISEVERDGGWFDWKGAVTSTISLDTIPTDVATNAGITESGRFVQVRNNVTFWPQKQKDFWKANDTIIKYTPSWMNARTLNMFDTNKTKWPKITQSGNLVVEPGFPAREMRQIDSLITYCQKLRNNTQVSFLGYYNPGGDLLATPWPYPLDLSYTNAALKTGGTDGLPVGDLNWYPAQRAAWSFVPTSVEAKGEGLIPEEFTLSQNYPNPFNPTTNISFGVKAAGHVKLVVYNALGQQVRTLADQQMAAGNYVATWDGRNERGLQMASGVYFYRLEAKSFTATRSMLLVK